MNQTQKEGHHEPFFPNKVENNVLYLEVDEDHCEPLHLSFFSGLVRSLKVVNQTTLNLCVPIVDTVPSLLKPTKSNVKLDTISFLLLLVLTFIFNIYISEQTFLEKLQNRDKKKRVRRL